MIRITLLSILVLFTSCKEEHPSIKILESYLESSRKYKQPDAFNHLSKSDQITIGSYEKFVGGYSETNAELRPNKEDDFIMPVILGACTYELPEKLKEIEKDQRYEAKYTVYCPDLINNLDKELSRLIFGGMFGGDSIAKKPDRKKILNKIKSEVSKSDFPKKSETITVALVKEDNKWVISLETKRKFKVEEYRGRLLNDTLRLFNGSLKIEAAREAILMLNELILLNQNERVQDDIKLIKRFEDYIALKDKS